MLFSVPKKSYLIQPHNLLLLKNEKQSITPTHNMLCQFVSSKNVVAKIVIKI
jgi:hypothetical protein